MSSCKEKSVNHLSFVKFKREGTQCELVKCTLFESVYIFANKLFEEEDKYFKMNEQDIQDNQKLFQNKNNQPPLKDFENFMRSDSEYIHNYNQQKKNNRMKESFNDSKYEEQKGESKQDANKDNSKLKSQEMNNLILVLKDQANKSKSLSKIDNEIWLHLEEKNVIQMQYFMHMNKFETYQDFNSYLSRHFNALKELYQKQKKQEDLKSLSQIKKIIKKALKDQTNIILFQEYEYQTDEIQGFNVPCYDPPYTNVVYYVIATQYTPDFNDIVNTLNYYHKSSPYCIYSNIYQRLRQIMLNTTKDAIRISLTKDLQENKKTQKDGIYSIPSEKYEDEKLDMWESKDETESLVYKNICSHGLLPINVYLNNQNNKGEFFKKFKEVAASFFIKTFGIDMPFPPKFHLNIQMMNKFYSFSNNSIFNCKDIEIKEKELEYQYIKIRVLDYFPLDCWVEELAKNFIQKIIPEIKNYFEEIRRRRRFQHLETEDYKNFRHFYLEKTIKQIETTQLIKSISYQFLREYYSELRIFQKWSQIQTSLEINFQSLENNCQSAISQFINYLTNVCDENYESCDGAYDLLEFTGHIKRKNYNRPVSRAFSEKYKSIINLERPFANSILNIQNIKLTDLNKQDDYTENLNEELLQVFQKFSNKINRNCLDVFMEPIIFDIPIPKYSYFCERSHRNYIELIQKNLPEIEQFYKIVDEFLEDNSSSSSVQNQQNRNFDIIKKEIVKDIKEKSSTDFDITHKMIVNIIKDAQNEEYKFTNSVNDITQQTDFPLLNIVSLIMSLYDCWYFQRKSQYNQYKENSRDYYKQYQVKDILNELSYYYYNSVRLANEVIFKNDNIPSIIGHVLIKNPAKSVDQILKQQTQSQIKKNNLN